MSEFDWETFDIQRPQRKAEILAAAILQRYFAHQKGLQILDEGLTNGPDLVFMDGDLLLGLGDVKGDFDGDLEAQRSAFDKLGSHSIKLEEGLGLWIATISAKSRVEQLRAHLPDFIRELAANGVQSLSPYANWHYGLDDLAHRAKALGISSLHGESGPGDMVHFATGQIDGFISGAGAFVEEWLRSIIALQGQKTAVLEVSKSGLPHKHLFVWIAENTSSPIRLSATWHPEIPPLDVPELPDWITHLWVGIPRGFSPNQFLWLYQPSLGWSVIELPGLTRPESRTPNSQGDLS
jgi:hypothetical protein